MSDLSIRKLADDIITKYDRNNNGVIDLKGNDNSYFADEMSEKVIVNRSVSDLDQCNKEISEDRLSLSNLFVAANKDNDNKVTKKELISFISEFNENKPGNRPELLDDFNWLQKLNPFKKPSELEKFEDLFPEKVKSRKIPMQNPGYTHSNYHSHFRFIWDEPESHPYQIKEGKSIYDQSAD